MYGADWCLRSDLAVPVRCGGVRLTRAESLVFYRRYFVCVHLFGLFRSGKEGACLFDEGCRVFVARGEMPYQQPAGLGFRGGFCGLQGSGVPCLPGERRSASAKVASW